MNKRVMFTALYATAFAIVAAGAFFSIYSYLMHVSFSILGTGIPGSVFGLVATFLGVRYMVSLKKLKRRMEESKSEFSWNNFKKPHSV